MNEIEMTTTIKSQRTHFVSFYRLVNVHTIIFYISFMNENNGKQSQELCTEKVTSKQF